jgi:hypothetical protein
MKIKISSFYSLRAVFIAVVIGLIYLQFIAIPVLRGQSDIYAFVVGDAQRYTDMQYLDDYLQNLWGSEYGANKFNMLGMLILGKTALWISPKNFEYVIFCFNILILAVAIRNFQHIFEFYKSSQYRLFLVWFLLNPLVLMSTVALNKEILGIFFVSSFLRHRLYRTFTRYFIVVLISFFIRDAYAATGILFLLMTTLKVKKVYYIFFVSLLLPFVVPKGMTELLIRSQDELSKGVSLLVNNIQSYPLGYLLVYFPKLILDMFGPLSPIRFFETDSTNLVAVYTKVSALLFLLFTGIILHIHLHSKRTFNRHLVSLFFAYTLIACLSPFFHHRYIFPIYPVLVMMPLLGFSQMPAKKRYINNPCLSCTH